MTLSKVSSGSLEKKGTWCWREEWLGRAGINVKRWADEYRKIKDNNGRSGTNRKRWKWFDLMYVINNHRAASVGREGEINKVDWVWLSLEVFKAEVLTSSSSSMVLITLCVLQLSKSLLFLLMGDTVAQVWRCLYVAHIAAVIHFYTTGSDTVPTRIYSNMAKNGDCG